MAEIKGTPRGSLVHRFITSGKPGKCELCPAVVEKLEAHHISYNPEITIKLCHACHHKSHFWPNRLNEDQKLKLLSLKFGDKMAREIISEKHLGIQALAKLIAPSRSSFIHKSQLEEIKRVAKAEAENPRLVPKFNHSPKVRNINKEVKILEIKRITKPKRVKKV